MCFYNNKISGIHQVPQYLPCSNIPTESPCPVSCSADSQTYVPYFNVPRSVGIPSTLKSWYPQCWWLSEHIYCHESTVPISSRILFADLSGIPWYHCGFGERGATVSHVCIELSEPETCTLFSEHYIPSGTVV